MPLSLEQLRNAIQLVGCDHHPVCQGYRWEIQDANALSQLVAWTLQGHYRHAERVLLQLAPATLGTRPSVQQQAIERLTLPAGTPLSAPARWHRDGLVFQHIAWIAAVLQGEGRMAASIPHSRPAEKGFDALLVPLENDGMALQGIVVCEEKATVNPRAMITSDVWPSITAVEAGERDAELTNELTALLERYQVGNLDQVIADAHWLNRKAYRVSITIAPAEEPAEVRAAIFGGFDTCAPGGVVRRRAETLTLPNLRDWMDTFCAQVIAAI
jgi:hypothetical protein